PTMNLFTWINELLGTENAESIIAISALLAWMLPKLLYLGVKFIFNTLLFLANVFSRDKLELWLKNKINYFLSSLAHGAKVSDIPRWLNKDQLALREVHWQRAGLVVDVPSVIVTINLPSFGYNVFKLKLRYLFNQAEFMSQLDKLLHNSVREIRVQEPAITYVPRHLRLLTSNMTEAMPEEKRESIITLLQEAVDYHLHVLVEHGSLQLKVFGEHFVVQNINFDLYNRAASFNANNKDFLFTAMLTGIYEGANISLCNKLNSLTEYQLGINKLTITPGLWRAIKERCSHLEQLEFAEGQTVGVLRDIRLAFKAGDGAQITGLEGEYRIIKPTIKAWRSFEVPHSLEGVLSWNEQGLALPDNFLVFKNGLRLRIPCEWQDGRLKMNFPTLDDLKQRYLGIVQQAKEAAKSYLGKLW
ncbi:MAG: hypothetical protein U0K79_00260, partial [Phascolarctobacterium sp.]|nr:hypothetical protein [Phascolarctobacterium sp.]